MGKGFLKFLVICNVISLIVSIIVMFISFSTGLPLVIACVLYLIYSLIIYTLRKDADELQYELYAIKKNNKVFKLEKRIVELEEKIFQLEKNNKQ